VSLEERLRPLDAIFRAERVGYAIIGAFAVAAWGEVRGTRDLDILTEASGIARIADALERSGYSVEVRTGDADDPITTVVRAQSGSGDEVEQVDILAGIRGAPPGIVGRARQVALSSLTVPVASPEDMIVLKLLAGSAQDLEDARGIVRIQGNQLARATLDDLCPPPLKQALDALFTA